MSFRNQRNAQQIRQQRSVRRFLANPKLVEQLGDKARLRSAVQAGLSFLIWANKAQLRWQQRIDVPYPGGGAIGCGMFTLIVGN